MKRKSLILAALGFSGLLLQGCIAFPPLVQIEHKDSTCSNAEIVKRLDAIDRRLDQMDQKTAKQ